MNGECVFNLGVSSFNAMMPDCYSIGEFSFIDVLNNTCEYGEAQNGNYFLGLGVGAEGTGFVDELSLKLTSPIVPDENYQLTFYSKKDIQYISNLLEVGYSNDSVNFGISIDTVYMDNTEWTEISISFSPVFNSSYITIRPIIGEYGWNLIDNFKLEKLLNIDDTFTEKNCNFTVYPNPSNQEINILYCENIVVEQIKIIDLHGNIVLLKNEKILTMNLSRGIYFIELRTLKGVEVKKIVIH